MEDSNLRGCYTHQFSKLAHSTALPMFRDAGIQLWYPRQGRCVYAYIHNPATIASIRITMVLFVILALRSKL